MDYTSVTNVKNLLHIESEDQADDMLIGQFIAAASAHIARETGREFVAESGTRYFDAPADRELKVDEFVTLTSITNGNGANIPTTEVILLPNNHTPKTSIKLKGSAAYAWTTDAYGNAEQAITVVAEWGYAIDAPADIRTACESIVVNLYRSKLGPGAEGAATITGAGVVITPKDVSAFAQSVINSYRDIL